MANLVSKFGFTNVTPSVNKVTPVTLDVTSQYSLQKDEPSEVVLGNITCPIDQGELVSFKCSTVKSVSSTQDILYPSQVSTGIQYVIKLEEIVSTTSDTDPSFRVDQPLVAYLTIRHQKSGIITPEMIGTVVTRLLGACQKSDGTWRFGDLMRSALRPTVN